MTPYDIYWLPFEQGNEIVSLLGYDGPVQLPVLIYRGADRTFSIRNVIMGMQVALTQDPSEFGVSFDKQRALEELLNLSNVRPWSA